MHANRPVRGISPPTRHRSDRRPTSETVSRSDVTWNSDRLPTPSIGHSCPAVVWYRPWCRLLHRAGVAPTAGSPAGFGSGFSDNRRWLPLAREPVVRRPDHTQTRLPPHPPHAGSHMVDAFGEGWPLRPCPVNRGIPAVREPCGRVKRATRIMRAGPPCYPESKSKLGQEEPVQ